jgi:excinuclease ABC subunit A
LSPVIAIEQKTTSKSPRSTVGTVTELYDYLRLLYARIGTAYSYLSNKPMVSYSQDQIHNLILNDYDDKKIAVLSPLIKSRKGHYRDLFENLTRQGFLKARVNGKIMEISKEIKLDRYKNHDIELLIDVLKINYNDNSQKRLKESIKTAMHYGKDSLMIIDLDENENISRFFSTNLMCETSGISYPKPEPNSFSFNSPKGMCNSCKGLGFKFIINRDKIIPDKSLSINNGGIIPLGENKNNWSFKQIETISKRYDFDLNEPIDKIPNKALEVILNGDNEKFSVESKSLGVKRNYLIDFEGIENFILNQYNVNDSRKIKRWAKGFMDSKACTKCNASRLNNEANYYKINGKNIFELSSMDLKELSIWFESLFNKLSDKEKEISIEIIKEIKTRLNFLISVGLNYLSLSRSSKSLSGGEAQRIRLATQIGSQLVGVLYILDEPSIGLHQRDNHRLIKSLESLRDLGNSVIVVEHDKEMILKSDHIIDLGPRAGLNGGKLISQGTPKELLKVNTLTANYLKGKIKIPIPKNRRKGNGNELVIQGCRGNNLKNISVSFPLGLMIGVVGVSGSGKSSLINDTLYPILNNHFYNGVKEVLPYDQIKGIKYLDKVVDVNQSPIGRTPRSNPATYCGIFSEIRLLFSKTQESLIRGYKPGRFSFNVSGGRCESCTGGGMKVIEMNFLPDVYVECESCQGNRFNNETLEILYKGKNISDILKMTINQAVAFFKSIPKIHNKLKTIQDVGLGYIALGQPSTTLSGGEAQRIKLSNELSKKDTGNTIYILDEPTTGLHFEDIRVLLEVLNRLVDKGNTVLIIEHNLDVIKQVDHVIEIGPEGGKYGGELIGYGSPEKISKLKNSHTGQFLFEELKTL